MEKFYFKPSALDGPTYYFEVYENSRYVRDNTGIVELMIFDGPNPASYQDNAYKYYKKRLEILKGEQDYLVELILVQLFEDDGAFELFTLEGSHVKPELMQEAKELEAKFFEKIAPYN